MERRSLQVTVDNTPPEVELINPEPDDLYERDPDPLLNDWINIQVDAKDNFSISRVEYFLDNEKIGESTVAPFTMRWNVVLTETNLDLGRTVYSKPKLLPCPPASLPKLRA